MVPVEDRRRRGSATRRASCAGSSGRSSTARSSSASTRRRTCRASCPTGSRWSACPAREDPADALHRRRRLARRARARAPGSGPRACAGARSCSRCAPTSRSSSCAATSTRAWRSSPRASYDGIVLAAAGLAPARARGRDLVPVRARGDDPGRRARAASRSRPRDGDGGGRRGGRGDHRPRCADRADRRARGGAGAGGELRHAGRRLRARSTATTLRRSAATPACRTAASGSATGSSGDPEQPVALGEALAERMLAAGRRGRSSSRGAVRAMSARPGIVYLVGAGPGDPGLMTARALELIARGRRDPPRPPDPRRRRSTAPAPTPSSSTSASSPASSAIEQDEIEALMVERARGGPQRRPPEGRRPVRVRPRRRGGRGAGRRPGSSSRSSPGSPPASRRRPTPGSRSPTATTPRRSPSSPATRTRRRTRPRSTGRRWRASPARSSSTWASRTCRVIAERLAAAGRDPAEPAAAIERGTQPGQRTVDATLAELAGRGRRRRAAARPRSCCSARSPRGASRSPGSSAARSTAGASSSPAPAPRRAGSPRPCAALGAEVVELPAIRIEPRIDTAEVRDAVAALHTYALVCLTSPNGVAPAVRGDGGPGPRRARARQRDRRRDRPRHRRGARASAG